MLFPRTCNDTCSSYKGGTRRIIILKGYAQEDRNKININPSILVTSSSNVSVYIWADGDDDNESIIQHGVWTRLKGGLNGPSLVHGVHDNQVVANGSSSKEICSDEI